MCLPTCGCFGIVFFLVNVILFLVGVAIVILGAILKVSGPGAFGVQFEWEFSEELLQPINNVGDTTERLGFTYLPISLIILGAVICGVALIGLISSCPGFKVLIIVYLTIMCILVFVQVLLVILFTTGVFNEKLKDAMKAEIHTNYESFDSEEPLTATFNAIMQQFNCCGVDDYEDFHFAAKWVRRRRYENGYITLNAPIACCEAKYVEEYRENKVISPNIKECAAYPTTANSYFQNGCFQAISDAMDVYHNTIYIAVGIVLILQIAIIVLGILAYKM